MAMFFHRCKLRLQALGYSERDELYTEVLKAYRALDALQFLLWDSGPYSTQKRDEELPPASDPGFLIAF
jgi:hypothetical protein